MIFLTDFYKPLSYLTEQAPPLCHATLLCFCPISLLDDESSPVFTSLSPPVDPGENHASRMSQEPSLCLGKGKGVIRTVQDTSPGAFSTSGTDEKKGVKERKDPSYPSVAPVNSSSVIKRVKILTVRGVSSDFWSLPAFLSKSPILAVEESTPKLGLHPLAVHTYRCSKNQSYLHTWEALIHLKCQRPFGGGGGTAALFFPNR